MKTILRIDDDQPLRTMIGLHLSRKGYPLKLPEFLC
jgi:hypothetical protein